MKNKLNNFFKILCGVLLSGLLFIIPFFMNCVQADTIDYELLTNNYTTTLYLYNTNVVDTQSNLTFTTIEGLNMIDTRYPYVSGVTNLNREVITYSTTKTINSNMNLYMKYNNTVTRINFNLNNEIQFSFIQNTTPTTVSNNLNVYKFTDYIDFDTIEIFNNYIGSNTETPFYFTILNANERAYNLGYDDAMEQYNILQNRYNNLEQQYNNLQEQYNGLISNDYTFENLFWSVGSVPMSFLMQSFNVDVLGINIRAIITGLITAIIVIWIIKKILR